MQEMKWYIDVAIHLTKKSKYAVRSYDGDKFIADISNGEDAERLVEMHNAAIDALNPINRVKKHFGEKDE